MEIILLISLFINFIFILNLIFKSNDRKEIKSEENITDKYHNCDILLTPTGLYVPTVNGRYLYIWNYGKADYQSYIGHGNNFRNKEDAKEYLDKWLSLRGVGIKSVGL